PDRPLPDAVRLFSNLRGATFRNDRRRIQGQLGPPLSDRGREQAERLAQRFRDVPVDAFYSSDLLRARATADAIGAVLGRSPEVWPELREVALGEWEGKTRDEIVATHPERWRRWIEQPSWDVVPGGEGTDAFEGRVGAVIERVGRRHVSGRVLIVTHGGVIQVALLRVVGRSSNGLFPFTIENTSLTVLQG